jgi:uncharacterized protein YggU (UPF0235/DUF167 family)
MPEEVSFTVRLTPRAGVDRVDGVIDGTLRARVAAPPAEGAANTALLRLLAGELGLPRRSIRIAAGETSRTKVIAAAGLRGEELVARWPGLRV